MKSEISLVIPCIKNSWILNTSIEYYLKVENLNQIFIVIEEIDENIKILHNKITYIKVKKNTNMSKKRNIAVDRAESKYVGFYDSDSYPKNSNILEIAQKIFQMDQKIYAIGGPDVSPEGQSKEKKLTAQINKSYFISGFRNYRKIISKSKYVKELSSCNLIMEKSKYLEMGGMNEKIFHAEDTDFFNRILAKGYSMYYCSDFIAYHMDRGLKLFFIQRYVRGILTAEATLDFLHKILTKKTIVSGQYRYEYLLTPSLSLYILLTIFYSYFYKIFFLIFTPLILFFILIGFESFRIKQNEKFIPIFFLLLSVVFLQSFASLFAFFGLRFNVKKIYRNENDI